MKFTGQCVCGSVTWTVDGEAVSQFYCHCRSCQKATSAPAVAIAIFPASDVAFSGQPASLSVTGEEGAAARLYCAGCGTRVANKPGAEGFTELLAMFPPLCDSTDWFQPSMHLFYEESGIEVSDKLPKYLDMPKAFGGSGKTL